MTVDPSCRYVLLSACIYINVLYVFNTVCIYIYMYIYIHEIHLDSTSIEFTQAAQAICNRNNKKKCDRQHRTNCHHPRHISNCQTTTTRDFPCWLFRENTRLDEHWTTLRFLASSIFVGIKSGIQSSPRQ